MKYKDRSKKSNLFRSILHSTENSVDDVVDKANNPLFEETEAEPNRAIPLKSEKNKRKTPRKKNLNRSSKSAGANMTLAKTTSQSLALKGNKIKSKFKPHVLGNSSLPPSISVSSDLSKSTKGSVTHYSLKTKSSTRSMGTSPPSSPILVSSANFKKMPNKTVSADFEVEQEKEMWKTNFDVGHSSAHSTPYLQRRQIGSDSNFSSLKEVRDIQSNDMSNETNTSTCCCFRLF